ncbi:hypothetical protein [Citrobacter pasteurii]|nr:hypothetical protein SF123566_9976 [Shigella flexneri 1235-66]CEJ65255.1 hypothetical protein [Citrobacter pasteurii]
MMMPGWANDSNALSAKLDGAAEDAGLSNNYPIIQYLLRIMIYSTVLVI